jgi:DNA-binding response OmpR family regulator
VTEGLKIVIVEDDALMAMDLADLLIGMGHDVRAIAQTETEAVAAAIRCEPNFMIVDGILSGGSGVLAMRQILSQGFMAHLYVTGDPLRLLQLALDAVVVAKPFNMQALENGIAKAWLLSSRVIPASS